MLESVSAIYAQRILRTFAFLTIRPSLTLFGGNLDGSSSAVLIVDLDVIGFVLCLVCDSVLEELFFSAFESSAMMDGNIVAVNVTILSVVRPLL